jgi:Rod binding domain-containing protein
MTIANMPQGFSFSPAGTKVDEAAAAREFEALLVARLLKTAREAGQSIAGTSKQTGEEGYMELAEEHVARAMAQRGAFGISQILLQGLERKESSAGNPPERG